MGNGKALEEERRDNSDIIVWIKEIIVGIQKLEEKIDDKLSVVTENKIKIQVLEEKNRENKTDNRFNWTQALSIISIVIAFSGVAIGLFLFIQRGLNG